MSTQPVDFGDGEMPTFDGTGLLRFTMDTTMVVRPVAGCQAVVTTLAPIFWGLDCNDQGWEWAEGVTKFGTAMSALANAHAAEQGKTLHHAEFLVTRDPDLVSSYGMVHDCPECEEMTLRALARLEAAPDEPMLIALLFWAKT